MFSIWKLAINNIAGVSGFLAQESHVVNQTPNWLFRRMLQDLAGV
jgi:hypothetical protein